MKSDLTGRVASNPFLVLGITPAFSRREMEREGQKLLGMLELGMAEARSYPTVFGPRPRTPEMVREAMAELRDPGRRLAHELFFLEGTAGADADRGEQTVGWSGAFSALGFSRWPSR